ncbi:MAG: (2Fe-2S)-binding protein [Thermodesulfovibrionales bacterium]|nr:(2Fe-2S)-binding protein [Thermodesulfovibrionales bacterium]
MTSLFINGKRYKIDVSSDTPLLWILRDHLGLVGTKFGCGIAQCGACTVLVDGKAVRSCQTFINDIKDKKVTTIEGIPESHPVKKAWILEDVPQCGYCQPGQIMQAISLLSEKPNPTDEDIDNYMSSCLCRCGTYQRIKKAIHLSSQLMSSKRGKK